MVVSCRLSVVDNRAPTTDNSLFRGRALGCFRQTRFIPIRCVALDDAALGRLVDLGEADRHRAGAGDRSAHLPQRAAKARSPTAIARRCFLALPLLLLGRTG